MTLGVSKLARQAVRRHLLPELKDIVREAAAERNDSTVRLDTSTRRTRDSLRRAEKEVSDNLIEPRLEAMARQVANRTNDYNRDELKRQLKGALGVDVLAAEPFLQRKVDAFVQENVSLITSIAKRSLDQVESLVQSQVTAGASAGDIASDIEERFDVSESRATLIARDQVGKFYGALTKARQTALGLEEYEWSTAGDERVRPEHAERDGQRFSWDDPPEDGHPGEAIQCRCVALPVLDSLIEEVDQEEEEEV
jgi:SPP1 gp7 family putative phage head morphogenesis protein